MLVRVGSLQTNDELWINPEHVIHVRVQKSTSTAIIKLSDGTTHNVRLRDGVPIVEADAVKLLNGRSASRLTDLLASRAEVEEPRFARRVSS